MYSGTFRDIVREVSNGTVEARIIRMPPIMFMPELYDYCAYAITRLTIGPSSSELLGTHPLPHLVAPSNDCSSEYVHQTYPILPGVRNPRNCLHKYESRWSAAHVGLLEGHTPGQDVEGHSTGLVASIRDIALYRK